MTEATPTDDTAPVLLVDDEPELLEALSRLLTARDIRVVTAMSGRAAMEIAARTTPRVLITDIFMPDGDGLELLRYIRHRHPDVPVIAMSGGGSTGKTEMLEAAHKLGAREILYKPFNGERLFAAIRTVLAAP